ncbi:hypothetical protein DRQ09_00060 [candidate division KSB1 bacterium]|nr:MAG: hypothetical protein DRQ09_00060 [candidate division KSB1 bacterium]
MKVKLDKLKEGENLLDYRDSPSILDLPEENFSDPIILKGIVEKRGKNYYFKIEIETSGFFQCDRCLVRFKKDIRSSLFVIYSKEHYIQEESRDNFYIIPDDEDEVDLSKDIRDEILLTLPIKLLCDEDCKGICAGCGADLNVEECRCRKDVIDPRWDVLKKIKFE